MTTGLPPENEWPPWLLRAAGDVGVRELPGIAVHPRIAEFYMHTRLPPDPNDDEVSWCAAAMCAWFEEMGYRTPHSARARDWLGWGEPLDKPRFGCVVVFSRGNPSGKQGHVALYCQPGQNGHVLVLGGNQGDAVRFQNRPVANILGYRWPRDSDRVTRSDGA
jgi:uncharacterized protein (TIGR02594 family)